MHHTNCGMEFFTDEIMRGLLANSLETAALGPNGFYDVGEGPGATERRVHRLAHDHRPAAERPGHVKAHSLDPLVLLSIPIYGYIYDVATGKLNEFPDATAAGRATRARGLRTIAGYADERRRGALQQSCAACPEAQARAVLGSCDRDECVGARSATGRQAQRRHARSRLCRPGRARGHGRAWREREFDPGASVAQRCVQEHEALPVGRGVNAAHEVELPAGA